MTKDLVVLAADKDIQQALRGLFERPQALDIRPIQYDVLVHPQHDPACALRGVEFLANFAEQYRHDLLIFDHEGCGREQRPPSELKQEVNGQFVHNSEWGDRARALVLSPELEVWVWSDSPHVDEIAGWSGKQPTLRQWLADKGWTQRETDKPERPKEAFEDALRHARKPRSSSLYRKIAQAVSLNACTDETFVEFRNLMRGWFPPA